MLRAFVDDALRLCLELADTNQMNRVHDKLINYHFIHSVSDEMLRCADELRDAAGREADKRYRLPNDPANSRICSRFSFMPCSLSSRLSRSRRLVGHVSRMVNDAGGRGKEHKIIQGRRS